MLIDRDDGALCKTVASILEGFPLASAMPVFEAAAASLAVAGHNRSWDGLKWLCLFNEVDPEESASALRNLSATVRQRSPEPGIHSDLPARVAALLLWLTGFEADEEAANRLDPGIDRGWSYETDYLPNPGRSFFALERRHSHDALLDTSLALHFRIQRAHDMLLDPSFEVPSGFITEVRVAAAQVDVEKLNRHMSYTAEDHGFEQFEPILARCAPDLLVDLARRKLQSFSSCPPASRYWSAIQATDQFVVVDGAEAGPAQILRKSATESRASDEAFAAAQLLILELRELSALEQIMALVDADLNFLPVDLGEILKQPASADVEALIVRFGEAGAKQQRDLLALLSFHADSLNGSAWTWSERLACADDDDVRGLAFKVLACADGARFGRRLADWNWHWSKDEEHFWINHFGSGALIEATLAVPFDQIAPRIAPWRLLEAVRRRGTDPAEVRMAGEIFGKVLAAEKLEEFDPGSTLSVDCTGDRKDPLAFSIQLRASDEDADNPAAAFQKAMDADEQQKAHRRAAETAMQRIREARSAGANLYLADVAAEDFKPVIEHCPELIDGWLSGMNEQTEDFDRRVRLAEVAYLSLCEALLGYDPERGVVLWRTLRRTITTHFVGAADVDELLHVAFRVSDSQAITTVRDELFGLGVCNTDETLFELAIAATLNGKVDWLTSRIAIDEASPFVWRRKRATVLSGFLSNNELPIAGAWPDGQATSSHAELKRKSARVRSTEAAAHHWWRAFLAAQGPAEAYATWVLFLRSSDRRAYVWLGRGIEAPQHADSLSGLKSTHLAFNRQALKREVKKRPKDLDRSFLGCSIVEGFGPWIENEL